MPESTIGRMCREARETLNRSIGTKAGIACARIRQQAQQLRTQHEKRS
jgi:hypothetical protein